MSLDPAASPWSGVIASVAVCLWIAAIGALLAYAVFRDRPRLVWPFYAPIVGVAVVLLITNLAAYVMPGAPSAWFGLLVPSAAALVVARRAGPLRPLPQGSGAVLLAVAFLAVGVFALAFANRMHEYAYDASWHFGLTSRMARGAAFPPVTPYGVDAGIGYHYGVDLLAASIVNLGRVLPWTAFDALAVFLVASLVLAVAGFAFDVGAPLPLALGLGATVGLMDGGIYGEFDGGVFLGYRAGYLEDLAIPESSRSHEPAFMWMKLLQRPLAVVCVVLVAAALHAGPARRYALVLAVAAGVLALADPSVMIFATAALALVGVIRLVQLRGRERLVLAGALVASALLVALAGGPVSDAIFDRGGTAGAVRMAWEPNMDHFLPFQQAGPALIRVGVIPLVAIGAIAAYRRRSWGVGFLVAAGAFGLLEAQLLQSRFYWHDDRIVWHTHAVAMIGALCGVGTFVGVLHGKKSRLLAALAVSLLILLPTSLPRAASGVQLAFKDLEVVDSATDDSGHHYRDRMLWGSQIEASWELYAWLRDNLPTEARLLTPRAHLSASAAGVASPISHRDHQMFNGTQTTWVYEDALRYLHRQDLLEMGITHLHVTDKLEAELAPSARRLLGDPRHFRLLVETPTSSGQQHRVYEARSGAGVTEVEPSSYRALRNLVPRSAPVTILGSPDHLRRLLVIGALGNRETVHSSIPLDPERATWIPRIRTVGDLPQRGVAVLGELLEPTPLGASRGAAIWNGHGLRAHDLAAAWSPVWRIGSDRVPLPSAARSVCESADGEVDLHVLGEPGIRVTTGSTETILTGLPQVVQLTVPDCGALTLSADSAIAPFVQIRARHEGEAVAPDAPIAGLGFDGGVDGERAVLNFWYRNPEGIAFTTGTEFRLYLASPIGVDLHPDRSNPRASSLRWWPGPVVLNAPEQTARVEFDARRLAINGDTGGGSATSLTPGKTYLLTLNVAGTDPRTGLAEIQHIVPVARVVLTESGVDYDVFSGVVTIEHHAPGSIS